MSKGIPNGVGIAAVVIVVLAALIGGWMYLKHSDPLNSGNSAAAQDLGNQIKSDPANKQKYIGQYVSQMMAKGKQSSQAPTK